MSQSEADALAEAEHRLGRGIPGLTVPREPYEGMMVGKFPKRVGNDTHLIYDEETGKVAMPAPNADKEYEITYVIKQKTTGPDPSKVIQHFFDEVKLQFNSSVDFLTIHVRDASNKSNWPTPAKIPGKTYQEQRQDGDVVEPEGDVVMAADNDDPRPIHPTNPAMDGWV